MGFTCCLQILVSCYKGKNAGLDSSVILHAFIQPEMGLNSTQEKQRGKRSWKAKNVREKCTSNHCYWPWKSGKLSQNTAEGIKINKFGIHLYQTLFYSSPKVFGSIQLHLEHPITSYNWWNWIEIATGIDVHPRSHRLGKIISLTIYTHTHMYTHNIYIRTT